MIDRGADGESAAEILQGRWFAAMRAAESARDRCGLLLDAMQYAENAWLKARARFEELEAQRDALADALAAFEDPPPDARPFVTECEQE